MDSDSWKEAEVNFFAEKNFADEITWITWKTRQDLEIWPFLNSFLKKRVWQSGPKIDPATSVRHQFKFQFFTLNLE